MNDKEKREKQVTNFAPNLRKYRQESPYTMKEIAEMLDGLPYPTYRNYENGKAEAPYFILCKLADIFNITVDELIGHPASEFNRMKEFYRNAGYDVKEGTDGKITVIPADNDKASVPMVYENKEKFLKDAIPVHDEFIKTTAAMANNIVSNKFSIDKILQKAMEKDVFDLSDDIVWRNNPNIKTAVDEFCSQIPVSTDLKQDLIIIEKLKAFLREKDINSDYYGDIFFYVMSLKGYPQKWGNASPFYWLKVSSSFALSVMGVDIKQGEKKHLIIKWGARDERK